MYKITLIFKEFVTVGDEVQQVEVKKYGECATWDDLSVLLSAQVEAFGSAQFEITEVGLNE